MKALTLAFFLLALAAAARAEEGPPSLGTLPHLSGTIAIDGDLQDPGWQDALKVDTFYETVFGDNRAPHVKTVAYLTYDDRYLYVGIHCQDPNPAKIRAPYVDRDNVFGDQDNFAIFLDTRNDRRSAQEFRVNPRGIQGDAIFNDANANEDFSPDFYYDTAARVTEGGWEAEVRIPLSSLRYPKADPQRWGILLWRNYPRDFRYAIYSSPLPRGSNCYICHSRELTGITGLPSASHLVAAPFVTAQDVARAPFPGAPLKDEPTDAEVGLDVKWTPNADMALDATLNPDFSQVEADVAQIAVNNRFALFFPEKRPFFLESVDLLDTPIQAVYTRTITSPRWGLRSTGKIGASSYTVLAGQDDGGGSVILPGPTSSTLAPQDFRSYVGVGRVRRDFGRSFVGLLATDREIEHGGYNRVLGPDFQWRRGSDTLTGQLLFSDTRTPNRPRLAAEWDGRKLSSHAGHISWFHRTRTIDWVARYRDFGDGFRADDGFVAQVGYRQGYTETGYSFFPKGVFSLFRPYVEGEYVTNRRGDLLRQRIGPGVFFLGKWNLQGFVGGDIDRLRTAGRILNRQQLLFSIQSAPSRILPRLLLTGFLGEDIDLVNVRVGDGASLNLGAVLRPTSHLDLQIDSAVNWLDVKDRSGREGRLFTAQVQRLKATYNFTPRMFLRLIGQYVATRREPALYQIRVRPRSRSFSGSALFSYRLNWQTAVFLGYGDNRALSESESLERTERQLFLKVSYAFQR